MILGLELKDIDDINNSGLWMICIILGSEIKALNVLNSLGVLIK